MRETSHHIFNQNSQQPKHIRGGEKKVMKKSLSLLVAIAMVFSMFASVAAAATTASDAGAKLQQLKVIKGDQSGDLMENATWKRQDLAVLLSRLLGKEAEAEKAAKAHTYADVPAGYYDGFLSWALANKYMEGNSATSFGFGDTLTNQQFYAVVLRALGVDTTGDNYAKTLELAVAAGIVAEGVDAKADAKRGDTYVAIITALDTEVAGKGQKLGTILGLPGYEVTVATATAKAVGAKKIEVTFSKAVDTAKAKFAVKNGVVTRDVIDTKFSDDKKVAVIELSTKLAAGATVVTIGGVEAEDVKAEFAAIDEKVTEIQFVGDKAALATNPDGTAKYTEMAIGYKLVNNYNEDVTKTAGGSLTFQVGRANTTATNNATTGVITFTTTGTPFALNESVYVSAILNLTSYGVTATKQVAVGQQAMVDSVDIIELWNSEKKELQTGFEAGKFFILVDAKDQYGKKVTLDQFKRGVFAVASNPALFTVDLTQAVDNVGPNNDKLALPLIQPAASPIVIDGTNTVRITTLFGGKSDSIDVPVKKAATLTTFALNAPAQVISTGQTVKIPFNAADQNGTALTKYNDLNGKLTLSPGLLLKQDYATKAAFIEYTAPGTKGPVFLTAQITNTAVISQLQLNIEDALVATSVTGVKDLNTSLAVGATIDLENKHIVLKDQYGRDLKLNDTVATHYVKVSAADGTADAVTGFGNLDSADDKITLTGAVKGTERVKVELIKIVGLIDNAINNEAAADATRDQVISSIENISFTVVDKDGISSYAVADIAKMSNKVGHEVEVKVEGVRADGSKVTLPKSAYTVSPANGLTYDASSNKLNATGVSGFSSGEAKASYTVNILANGEAIVKETVVSDAALVASSFEQKDANGLKGADLVVKGAAGDVSITNVFSTIKVKDQFGVEMTGAGAALSDFYVTVSQPDDVAKVAGDASTVLTVSATNGQSGETVTVSNVQTGDSFSVRFAAKASGAAIAVRVVAE
jgi:trimeric autotransporter adhesin